MIAWCLSSRGGEPAGEQYADQAAGPGWAGGAAAAGLHGGWGAGWAQAAQRHAGGQAIQEEQGASNPRAHLHQSTWFMCHNVPWREKKKQ